MIDINLSMRARLNLDMLLSFQEGTRDLMDTYQDIRDKLLVTQELREEYVIELPDGRVLVGPKDITKAAELEVALEKQEARVLGELLRTWGRFKQWEPKIWVNDLQKQLNTF